LVSISTRRLVGTVASPYRTSQACKVLGLGCRGGMSSASHTRAPHTSRTLANAAARVETTQLAQQFMALLVLLGFSVNGEVGARTGRRVVDVPTCFGTGGRGFGNSDGGFGPTAKLTPDCNLKKLGACF